jgi:hypothetical protein
MAEYPYPDPIVQVADVQELARDLVVIPSRRVQLVPNIGIIAGRRTPRGDQVITVPDAEVLFTGDLVETGLCSEHTS